MRKIFKIGKYWDLNTFLLYVFIGIIVAFCCKKAACFENNNFHKKNFTIKIRKKDFWYFIPVTLLSFLFTFRDDSVGADTVVYIQNFLNSFNLNFSMSRILVFKQNEILFEFFTYIIRRLTNNYRIYFFLISLMLSFTYVYFFKTFWRKNVETIFIVLFILMYTYNFAALRTAIGEMFILLSFCALSRNERRKAIFLTLIGSLCHYTMLINLLFIAYDYYVVRAGTILKKRLIYFIFFSTVIFFVSLSPVINFLLKTRYRAYIPDRSLSIINYWYIFVSVFIAFGFVHVHKENVDRRIQLAVVASVFSIIPVILACYLGAYRLPTYYSILRYFLWDRSISDLSLLKCNRNVIKLLAILLMFFYLVYQMGRNSFTPGFKYQIMQI